MSNKNTDIYFCMHNFFYLPSIQNPWINVIEKEFFDFHYNIEQLTDQCYGPNASSRCLDNNDKVHDIINNYEYMNFNFSPYILNWLEKNNVNIYNKIIEADKISMLKNNGHGNAIAQTFNQIIMPLCSTKDKITQIEWGIKDFKKHFNREPEALWLAENAINYETLEILIDFGFSYIILSPDQVEKVRSLSSKQWFDVSNGNINTRSSYRIYSKNSNGIKNKKRYIDCFFYDKKLSSDIFKTDILKNADDFNNNIISRINENNNDPQIITLSNNGEVFGYYKPFGNMCIAYFFKYLANESNINIINHGYFLEEFPSTYEAELKESYNNEGTSSSCPHGVGRWYKNCGCSLNKNFSQKWRTPLRKSFDLLNNRTNEIYSKLCTKYFNNIWDAKNYYYPLIFDNSTELKENFFKENAKLSLTENDKTKILKILEAEKLCQYMYSHSAWFFSDISETYSIQSISYAAKIIEILSEFDENIEKEFLKIIKFAKSNVLNYNDGEYIYKNYISKRKISEKIIVANFCISNYIRKNYKNNKSFQYKIILNEHKNIEKNNLNINKGNITIINSNIDSSNNYFYYLIATSLKNINCYIFNIEDDPKIEINNITLELFNKYDSFSLNNILNIHKEKLIKTILDKEINLIDNVFLDLYNKNIELFSIFKNANIKLPNSIKAIGEESLKNLLTKEVKNIKDPHDIKEYSSVQKILDSSFKMGINIDNSSIKEHIYWLIIEYMEKIQNNDFDILEKLINIYEFADKNMIEIELTKFQDILYYFIENFKDFNKFDINMINYFKKILTRFCICTSIFEEKLK